MIEKHGFSATDCTKKIRPTEEKYTLYKRKTFNFEAFFFYPSLREIVSYKIKPNDQTTNHIEDITN